MANAVAEMIKIDVIENTVNTNENHMQLFIYFSLYQTLRRI